MVNRTIFGILTSWQETFSVLIRVFYFIIFFSLSGSISAQQLYTGIVVDSAKLSNIPDVHISVKHKGKITSSSLTGSFMVYASTTDTLMFSAIGYITTEIPLMFEENTLLVMLREDRIFLNEVIIKSTRLYPNKIEERTKTAPRKMAALDGVISPFDYFSSLEREKRKLSKVVEENNRTQTYRQVITDPDVKEILMNEYDLGEENYYQTLVMFNQKQTHVHYFTDPDAIMEALHTFFENSLAGK
jgi:carboxypeptidase-like protein